MASIVIVSAVACADANAIAIRNAYFDATLSGTFTSSAHFFGNCPRAPGQAWFGKMAVRTTPVSTAQIFNRHRRTVVVTMRRSGRTTSQQGRPTSVVTFGEDTTIRLKRVG